VGKKARKYSSLRLSSGRYLSRNTAVEFITFTVLVYDVTEATSVVKLASTGRALPVRLHNKSLVDERRTSLEAINKFRLDSKLFFHIHF